MERTVAKKPAPARDARAARSRAVLDPSEAAHLHDRFGNAHLESLIRSRRLQPKRAVSQPGDPLEQEADRVAELVTTGTAPAIQRACSCGTVVPCDGCDEEEPVLRNASRHSEHLDSSAAGSVDSVLSSPGDFLRADIRRFFEKRIDR